MRCFITILLSGARVTFKSWETLHSGLFFFFQINGVDVRDAEHVQVVELLTGSERFVRLSVERKIVSPTLSNFPADFGLPPTPPSASGLESGKGVSPKVFGLPKPYTGLYSASSYMANRPSYMRTREPGQVRTFQFLSLNIVKIQRMSESRKLGPPVFRDCIVFKTGPYA